MLFYFIFAHNTFFLVQEAKNLGLDKSIFELLAGRMKNNVVLLETQYR